MLYQCLCTKALNSQKVMVLYEAPGTLFSEQQVAMHCRPRSSWLPLLPCTGRPRSCVVDCRQCVVESRFCCFSMPLVCVPVLHFPKISSTGQGLGSIGYNWVCGVGCPPVCPPRARRVPAGVPAVCPLLLFCDRLLSYRLKPPKYRKIVTEQRLT